MIAAEKFPEDDLLAKVVSTYGVDAQDEAKQSRFISEHICQLESSPNEAIARSGVVLRRANDGFGLGYKVPLALIAMGQAMLGIDLAVAAPFLASNPAAFTAASLGAVYYGYQALDDEERVVLHERIGAALDFGIELVKNIAQFCIDTMRSLLNPETLAQIKTYVAEFAEAAGSSLYEITGLIYDRIAGVASSAGLAASHAGGAISGAAASAFTRGRNYWIGDPGKDES